MQRIIPVLQLGCQCKMCVSVKWTCRCWLVTTANRLLHRVSLARAIAQAGGPSWWPKLVWLEADSEIDQYLPVRCPRTPRPCATDNGCGAGPNSNISYLNDLPNALAAPAQRQPVEAELQAVNLSDNMHPHLGLQRGRNILTKRRHAISGQKLLVISVTSCSLSSNLDPFSRTATSFLCFYFPASKMTFCAFIWLNKSYPSSAWLIGRTLSAMKLGE